MTKNIETSRAHEGSKSFETHGYKVLDLFSGIGGFSLGLERTGGFQTVAFCEIEPFCRRILNKHWPDTPIFEDIHELHATDLEQLPDVIAGGYPCQGESLAGKRRGKDDDRWLWPEYLRLIQECSPTWVIGENTLGHKSLGLDQVLTDLENNGYTWRTFIVPACAVGGGHQRYRVWIVANANSERLEERRHVEKGFGKTAEAQEKNKPASRLANLVNSDILSDVGNWPRESMFLRKNHGIPGRVDRVRALGNTVVPQIPEMIGQAILSL
jgi:DNA (cytosine-5)-methyltransferase 1